MGSEVDTAPLAVRLTARGLACAFPRVEGDRLVFVVCPPGGLVAGYRGGLEPPVELPPIDPASLAAVIVPGLAFTRSGSRLGQGGGFYDRWLAAHRLPTLGLGFGVQLADTLPLEPHDVLLDAVATERGLVERGLVERPAQDTALNRRGCPN